MQPKGHVQFYLDFFFNIAGISFLQFSGEQNFRLGPHSENIFYFKAEITQNFI